MKAHLTKPTLPGFPVTDARYTTAFYPPGIPRGSNLSSFRRRLLPPSTSLAISNR